MNIFKVLSIAAKLGVFDLLKKAADECEDGTCDTPTSSDESTESKSDPKAAQTKLEKPGRMTEKQVRAGVATQESKGLDVQSVFEEFDIKAVDDLEKGDYHKFFEALMTLEDEDSGNKGSRKDEDEELTLEDVDRLVKRQRKKHGDEPVDDIFDEFKIDDTEELRTKELEDFYQELKNIDKD